MTDSNTVRLRVPLESQTPMPRNSHRHHMRPGTCVGPATNFGRESVRWLSWQRQEANRIGFGNNGIVVSGQIHPNHVSSC